MAEARLVNVRIFQPAVREVLNQAPAHAAMTLVGNAVAAEVRTIVPRSPRTRQNASGEAHRHLSDHLLVATKTIRGVAAAVITANVPHAMSLHEGAQPHVIAARSPTTMLKFGPMPGYSTPFIGPEVNHPGYGGNPFFRIACERLGLPFHKTTTPGIG